MRYVSLPGTELRPSAVALGTARYGSGIPEDTAFRLMDIYADSGGNCLDTAHVYASWLPGGEGASERTVGKWLGARGKRDGFVVSTKGAHTDMQTGARRLRRECIRQDLAESLDRLGTDRVDLYWLHRDDPDVPVGEVLGWLNELVAEGRVRAMGCSNWTARRQREAARCAAGRHVTGFCASQIGWSLAISPPTEDPSGDMLHMDDGTYAFHEETGTPLFAYSSQAGGFFAGKYDRLIAGADTGCEPDVKLRFTDPVNVSRLEAARDLAKRRGVSANQVAVAWLLSHRFPVVAIAGPRTIEQAEDSAAAGSLTLSAEETAYLVGGDVMQSG